MNTIIIIELLLLNTTLITTVHSYIQLYLTYILPQNLIFQCNFFVSDERCDSRLFIFLLFCYHCIVGLQSGRVRLPLVKTQKVSHHETSPFIQSTVDKLLDFIHCFNINSLNTII